MVDFIDARKDEFGVEPICEELPSAPSIYYAAKTAGPSARAISDELALTQIRRVHSETLGVYGVRKIRAQLRREGHVFSLCTVEGFDASGWASRGDASPRTPHDRPR